MNHIYRSIWNQATGAYSAVSENVKGCGKRALPGGGGAVAQFALKALAASMMLGFGSLALAGPTGGVVVAGQANIGGAPGSMVINQGSQNAVINWNNFNIAHGESVTFQQPNSASVALNRVLGGDATTIMGNLSANGKVFLVNPNGVLFGKGASVNVGGLVASTLDISNADFMAGNYKFSGNGSGKVLNQGAISAPGGYVALLGANVSNEGTIQARLGSVALAAGNAITLDVAGDGLLNVTIDKGALNALVNNGGLIQADGGTVVLTAQAAGDLLKTVVNNTGIIEAHSIDTRGGTIKLLGDMQSGTVNAGGTLDASAPTSGNGGFIDTSAAHVNIASGIDVTTQGAHGLSGTWLIDPVDYTIAATGGNMTGADLTASLSKGSVQIQSTNGTGGTAGDINVNDTVSWSANKLTLTAQNNININKAMRGSGTASLALEYGQSAVAAGSVATYNVKAEIDLPSGNNFSTKLGSDGTVLDYLVINSLGTASSNSGTDLQGMKGATTLNYVLGSNIDASSTASWNSNLGFAPIGNATTAFTGKLDGLGHAISGLAMARISQHAGLFGEIGVSGSVRNVNLVGASVSMSDSLSNQFFVGLLAGRNKGLIENVNVSGLLTAQGPVFGGGLAGQNFGTINNSVSGGTFKYLTGFGAGYGGGGLVNRNEAGAVISNSSSNMTVGGFDGATGLATNAVSGMGGLAYYNAGLIKNSFATGTVRGGGAVGGLVGYGSGVGVITGSFATGAVSGAGAVGGLVGFNSGAVSNSYATGDVAINEAIGSNAGGLVGINRNSSGNISNSYATGNVSGYRSVGGVVGSNNTATINNVYSTGTVTETDTANHHSGGVVGENIKGTLSNGYYNATANGVLPGVGFASGAGTGLTGATGLSASQMQTGSNFASFVFTTTTGASGNNWVMVDVDGTLNNTGGALGATMPMLASEYSNKIYSAHQLQLMAMDTAANYTLAADINAATTGATSDVWRGGTFIPVGRDLNNPFTGSLDGVGHTIYGLVINRPNDNYSGLFGATSSIAIVRNIGLEGGSVTGSSVAGALVGANLGLVDSSYSTVSVTGGGSQIGGLVGLNGIISGVPGIVSNSYASGAVIGTGIIGGLAGSNSGTLTNNYATGTVTGGNTRGGLTGASNGSASGNFWDTTLSGMATSAAAAGLTTAQMKTLANFSARNWDLTSMWISYDGNSAPLLRAFMTPLQVAFASNASKIYDATSSWTPPAVTNSNTYAYALLSGSLNYGAAGSAVNAGTYAITAGGLYSGQHGYAINYNAATLTIAPKALTVTGVTAATRTYDRSTGVVLSGGALSGLVGTETLLLSGLSGTYADKNAGSVKAVTVTGAALSDAGSGTTAGLASNYTVTNPSGVSGIVNTAPITSVSGLTAGSRVYDGTNVATLGGTAVINGMITGDNLVFSSATGTFTDRNVGNGKTVNISGITLGGSDLVNYNFGNTNAATTASISAKALTVTGVLAGNKVYDGSLVASLSGGSLVGLVGTETLNLSGQSGAFGDQNVGTSKAVTVTGALLSDAGSGATAGRASNYTVSNATGVTANITPKALTVTGVTAANKIYDGSTLAALSGGALSGLVGTETLNMGVLSGAFADKNVGASKAVTVTGAALTNAGAGATAGLASNYTVSNPTGVVANITQKALTLSGMTASDKVYDGNIKASLSGGVLSGLVGTETIGFSGQSGVFADQNAASGKTVTVSGTTLADAGSGASAGLASNYTVSNPSGLLASIAQKALTITGATAANRVYDGTTAVTIGGALDSSGFVGTETVSLSGLSGAFADKNVGTAKAVTVSGAALTNGNNGGLASNYTVASPSGLVANVTKATISAVSNIVADSKVYDANTKATVSAASATFNGMASGDSLSFSATSALFNDKNAGTKTVTVSGITLGGTDAANYNLSSTGGTGTGSITPKAVTIINMTAINKVYDGTTKASVTGGAISGTVGAETLGATGLVATFIDASAGTGKMVTSTGTALVNGTGGGMASNYTVTNPTFTANITQKALTVSGMTAASRVYDGTTLATLTGGALSGLVTGETLVFAGGSGVFVDKNVGSNKTITVSGSTIADAVAGGTGLASNYTVTNPTTVTGSITQKALTLSGTLVASDKVYDGLTSASISGGALSGFVGTETVGLAGLSGIFADKNAGNAKVVAVNGGTLANGTNGGLASNYSISASGSLVASITQKALTVTGSTADNRVYDGTLAVTVSGGTLDNSGFVGTETVGLSSLSGAFLDKNVGTAKAVTVSGAALTDGSNGGLASNYSVASPSGLSANVTKATISSVSSIVADSKIYDANTKATVSAASATFNGMASGDSLAFSATSALFADKNVGTKAVTVSGIALGGTDAANYNLTSTAGTGIGSITPKAVTIINMTAVNKVYDGTTKASVTGGAISGTIGSETLGATGLVATFLDANAGAGKTVTSTGTALVNGTGGGLASNYTVTNPTFTANITPKALTVTGMTAGTKVYDGLLAASLSGGALSGLVTGETLVLSGGTGLFGDKNVGAAKAVTVSGSTIADGTGLASNYTVSNPTTVTGSITQKALTISGALVATDRAYDGTRDTSISGGTLSGFVGSETVDLTALAGVFADKNAGNGKVVAVMGGTLANGMNGGLASNYSATGSGNLKANITQKALTVTGSTADNRVYNGTTTATFSGGTLGGFVGSETVGLSSLSGVFADKNAGNNKAATITGAALTDGTNGGLGSNYMVTGPSGLSANIAKATLTGVSGIMAGNKVYDGNTAASLNTASATFNGMVAGDKLTASASGAFVDKNAATGKDVNISGIALGGLDSGNYNLTGTTALAKADIAKATIESVAGITAGNKVYDGKTVASLDTAGAKFVGMVADDKLTVSASGAFSDKNAATGKDVNISGIALGGVDAGNYNLTATTAVAKADIAKATIESVAGITAGNKVYDGNIAASLDTLAATFNGMVTGDKLTALASGAFVDKNAATGKDVNISGIALGGTDAGNYKLTATTAVAKADIAKATIESVSGITVGNKVYDGKTAASLNTTGATLAGIVAGDSLAVTSASGTFSDKNAALGKAVTIDGITLGGADAGNYTLGGTTAIATADITSRALTLTGQIAGNKVYDGNMAATLSGGALNGLVDGETLAIGGQTGTFSDKNAANGKTVTVSGTTLLDTSNGLASNYSVSNPTGLTASITQKALTVTGQLAGNKVYDGNLVASLSGGALNGLVDGETLVIGGQSATFGDKNAANGKTVTVNGTTLLDTANGLASNYSVSNPTGLTASITQKALTVSGQLASNKVYDGNTTAMLAGGTLSGLVGSETLVIGGQKATFVDKNAANGKAVTVSGTTLLDTASGLASNYTVSNPTGLTASISRAAISGVTGISAGNKVYDGTTQVNLNTNNAGFAGIVAGDQLGVATASGAFANKNAGSAKAVNVSGISLNGVDAGNYTLANTSATTTANIAQAQLAVTALSVNKVYDATTNATVVLADNRIAGDVLSVSSGTASFANKNAGVGKTVTVGGIALAGADAGNYAFNTTAATAANITQAALGIKVNDAVKNQGQVNPAFNASYSGFLGSDTVVSDVTGTLVFSTPATTASPAAAYQVAASGQASGNYAITYAPGVLTVNAVVAPPVVTPPVADEAVRSAIGTVVAMSTIMPSQGNMVHAELIIDKGVPEVAAAPATSSEQTDKDGTAPVIQVSANVMRSVLPGLKLSIVDRGILLPPEMSGTPASGGSE